MKNTTGNTFNRLFGAVYDIDEAVVDKLAYDSAKVITANLQNGTSSRGYTMEDLLCGSTVTATTSAILPNSASTKLAINYSDIQNLAHFGSVYATVASAIDNIRLNFPHGVVVDETAIVTGAGTVQIYHTGFTYADYWNFSTANTNTIIQNFDFVIYSANVKEAVWPIDSIVSVVSGSPQYSVFNIANFSIPPSASYTYGIVPKSGISNSFYASLSDYEYDLLFPSQDRTNYWPWQTTVPDLIVYSGTAYDNFIATELALALSADTEGLSGVPANVLWNKFVPSGIKTLDNNTLLQNFIITIGAMFDKIKHHQDQLAYVHTAGLDEYNHIPKNLVYKLSELLGLSISRDDKFLDLPSQSLKTFNDYVSTSSKALSHDDINFERYRRILTSLVNIYKAKGTKKAMEFILDLYGIPDELLALREFITVKDQVGVASPLRLEEVIGGVYIFTGGTRYYVDPSTGDWVSGSGQYSNSRYLDITISEANAIENDLWNWGKDNLSGLTGADGEIVILSGKSYTRSEFEDQVLKQFIPSDGSYKYMKEYMPLLSAVYISYLDNSVNKFTRGSLQPFIDFIEYDFMTIASKFIPASSKLRGQGVEYRNPYFIREKYTWQPPVTRSVDEGKDLALDSPTLVVTKPTYSTGSSVITNVVSEKLKQLIDDITISTIESSRPSNSATAFTPIAVTSTKQPYSQNSISPYNIETENILPLEDIHTVSVIYSGNSYGLDSPLLTPISSNSGTGGLSFSAYAASTLILSDDIYLNIDMSASNLSTSGISQILVELFEKSTEEERNEVYAIPYHVISTIYEGKDLTTRTLSHGAYKLSSISGLSVGDTLDVESKYSTNLNASVYITSIDKFTNVIRTTPPIGVDNLPIGENNVNVNLVSLLGSKSIMSNVIATLNIDRITPDRFATVLRYLINEIPPDMDTRVFNENEFIKYANYLSEISEEFGLQLSAIQSAFRAYFSYGTRVLCGLLLVLDFINTQRDTYLFNLESERQWISNLLIEKLSRITLRKNIVYYNWNNPVQSLEYNTFSSDTFVFPSTGAITDNSYSVTGTVSLGGRDTTRARVLKDKTEYFWRTSISTEVPAEYTGETIFDTLSGRNIINTGYDINVLDNVYYYGKHFTYMKNPSPPVLIDYPPHSSETATAAVYLEFKGVGDANRLDVEFIYDGPADAVAHYHETYTGLTSGTNMWNSTAATRFNVSIKPTADDRTVYTLQANLIPNSWYWWRIKNTKIHESTFGYNLEGGRTSEPYLLWTGEFTGEVLDEGEVPDKENLDKPILPPGPSPIPNP